MENMVSGLIIPWGNAMAITEAIDRIFQLPDRGLALGQAARNRMKGFSPERERLEWEALYREILSI
jgi:hypothetical protein